MTGAVLVAVVATAAGAAVVGGSRGSRLRRLTGSRGTSGRTPLLRGGGSVRHDPTPPRAARDGPTGATGSPEPIEPSATTDPTARRRRGALAALVVAVGALSGSAGVTLGLLVAGVVADRLLARLEPSSVRARTDEVVAALPAFADLVGATVRAGVPPDHALRVCAAVFGGPIGEEVTRVVTALDLGLPASRAWERAADVPGLEPLARAMARGASRGTSPVSVLERCSTDARRVARTAAQARARSVGVTAAAPLGLCFLPAFVLVSVVPTVVGGLAGLFR